MMKKVILFAIGYNTLPLRCLVVYANQKSIIRKNYNIIINHISIREINEQVELQSSYYNFLSYIFEQKPDIVGFTCYFENLEIIVKLATLIKKILPNTLIILGGVSVSSVLEKSYPQFDIYVRGEGEEIFRKILVAYLQRNFIKMLKFIKGISYWKNNNIIHNIRRPLLDDINMLPSPVLSIYSNYDFKNKGMVMIETVRGCIKKCKYCNWRGHNRNKIRYFSLERIKNELRFLINLGVREIRFTDSHLGGNVNRAKEIAKILIGYNGINKSIITTYLDIKNTDEELVMLISKINHLNIESIGLQSINSKTRKIYGEVASVSDYEKVIGLLEKYHVFYKDTDIICGLPGDNFKLFCKTFDYAHLKSRVVHVHYLTLLPNSDFLIHANKYKIEYNNFPPNELLSNFSFSIKDNFDSMKLISFYHLFIEHFYFLNQFLRKTDRFSFSKFYCIFQRYLDDSNTKLSELINDIEAFSNLVKKALNVYFSSNNYNLLNKPLLILSIDKAVTYSRKSEHNKANNILKHYLKKKELYPYNLIASYLFAENSFKNGDFKIAFKLYDLILKNFKNEELLAFFRDNVFRSPVPLLNAGLAIAGRMNSCLKKM